VWWRHGGLVVIGLGLILDGLAGWSTDVVAVVVGLVLIGAVSVDGLAAVLAGRAPEASHGPPTDPDAPDVPPWPRTPEQ
jgi:hypothetical protein